MLGKIIGSIVRLTNAPAKAVEKLFDNEDDPLISVPLEKLAEAFEDADKEI